MCIGLPSKIIELKNNQAKVAQGDHTLWLDIAMVSDENLQVGDYVLSYQNAAINKISREEAEKVIELLKES